MRTMRSLFVLCFCLLAPLLSKAQFGTIGYGDGLPISYSGSNLSAGQFWCRVHSIIPPFSSHGIEDYTYSYVGDNHVFTGAYMNTIEFNYKKSATASWVSLTGPSISTVNAMSVGSSLTYSNGCETFTLTKGPGYSVVGATYNYSLSVSVYEACP